MIREKLLKPEKKTDEGANQSYDLMRSGAFLIQQGLPYPSLSCRNVINNIIQNIQIHPLIIGLCKMPYLHKLKGALLNDSSPSEFLPLLSPQQPLSDENKNS